MPFCKVYKRMMGLEPTTFCMANASDVRARSRSFAPTACFQGLRPSERTRANPSERRTLPFLPRLARDRDAPVAGSYRGRDLDTIPRPCCVPPYRGTAARSEVNLPFNARLRREEHERPERTQDE